MAKLACNEKLQPSVKAEQDDTLTTARKLRVFWRRFKKNKTAVLGLSIIVFLTLVAIFAPFVATHDPEGTDEDLYNIDAPPSRDNWWGTDELGRDVFSRSVYGARISLAVGLVSVSIAIFIGTLWGAIAGYYGGRLDNVMMRIVDAIMSFPTLLLLITIMAVFEPSIWNVMIVLGLTSWPSISRFVRAEFLSLKQREFAEAARASGASDARIIFRHILPNATAPIIVAATLGLANAILSESALSFLGIGVQPPTPSWGNMLTNAQDLASMIDAPWKAFFPGFLIFVTVLSFNFLGDGLRDALDPRLKQ